ncbi:MAG: hypothetical protein RR764_12055 [Oscillospiraceae bacterium]
MFENVVLGFCLWDIPAAILLAAIITAFVMQEKKHKKRKAMYFNMQSEKSEMK